MEYYNALKQEFGIKDKEISILKAVVNAKLTAKKICDATGIPQGRIYEHLNNLLSKGLIERSPKKPFIYFVANARQNVLLFMKDKIDGMVKAQSEVIEMMEKTGGEHIERIESGEGFTYTHLNMISSSKNFTMIGVHGSFPYFLYPANFNDFMKLRNLISSKRTTISFTDPERTLYVYKTYKKAENEKRKVTVIFEAETFLSHMDMIKKGLGKPFLRKMIDDGINRIKSGAGNVYIINEHLPFQIDVNERSVGVSIKHKGLTNGLLIYSSDAVKMYSNVIEQHKKRAKSLLPILQKLRKQL